MPTKVLASARTFTGLDRDRKHIATTLIPAPWLESVHGVKDSKHPVHIKLNTGKATGGVSTCLTVARCGSERGFSVEQFVMFTDYCKTPPGLYHKGVRATEKNINQLHQQAIACLEDLVGLVNGFYGLDDSVLSDYDLTP